MGETRGDFELLRRTYCEKRVACALVYPRQATARLDRAAHLPRVRRP